MNFAEEQTKEVERDGHSKRLDAWLAKTEPAHSRARWQELIKQGLVQLNGKTVKPNHKVLTGNTVSWQIPEPVAVEPQPEDIPLDILFEDSDIIVINKQPGLVVHPAPGNETGTLVNALLHHCKDLQGIGGELRPGIVHRLDKDTSGVMVIAKNEIAMNHLMTQFKERDTHKEYLCLVWGRPRHPTGTVHTNIARCEHHRKKMAVYELEGRGKDAITNYRVEERFDQCTLVRCHIETGRTHQIRVHMTHLRHPIVGDSIYGRSRASKLPAPFHRQMLHAAHLEIEHPKTGEKLVFEAPLFDDMSSLLTALRAEQE
ncbi:RluA family pseudouridine synthase [Verrucomicrobiota bacterium]